MESEFGTNKGKFYSMKKTLLQAIPSFLFPVVLAACISRPICPSSQTPVPTISIAPPPTSVPPTSVPSATVPAVQEIQINPEGDLGPSDQPLPNLWTKIDKDKITIHLYDILTDYVVANDGSLWMTGGFGVIHQTADGQLTWYSIKNGLPNNFFNVIAISPKGKVWIGGNNNALFRFDGQQWIDEGEKLPNPYDDRDYDWLCYSKNIEGIDFGPDGSAWIMNGGIEIYRQAYGQWINIPFPKNILPYAGGGACPEGIRVIADNDITIKIGPC